MDFEPVRKVVTRSGKRIRGYFPSVKVGRMVGWESPAEADAIRLFEFNPGVASFSSQPSHEVYHDANGKACKFVPDFRVDFHHGGALWVEVKSDDDIAYGPTAFTLGLKAMAMQAQGRNYRVLSSSEIRKAPRFANLKQLERHAKRPLPPEAVESLDALNPASIYRIEELVSVLGAEAMVYRAIAFGSLRTDLLSPLGEESLVWHPHNAEAGDGSFFI